MTVFTHRETLNLAGSWDFVFDPESQGVDSGWTGSQFPQHLAEKIAVPGIWNVTHPGTDGIAFYQTLFTLPLDWQDQKIELFFEGVAYLASIWVNGQYVGSHEGAYTPFRLDITRCLRWTGQNQLVVRVTSLSQSAAVDGLRLVESPAAKQAWYYTFGGIWGKVYLEALPKLSCPSVRLTPDLQQQQVHIDLQLQNAQPVTHPANLRLILTSPSQIQIHEQLHQVVIPPGSSHFTFKIPIPFPELWSCQHPVLYRLKIELHDPTSNDLDVSETSFGMREFTWHTGQFFLNSEPLYIRGVILQPDYPITVITPPSPEILEKDLRLSKEAGFNLIRVHLRPPAPGFLDLADKLGLLVYAETCLGWIKDSPRLMEHGKREIQAQIERDYNHPSIVFWGIYNENPTATKINGQALAHYAHSLDPSRLVIHDSGGSLAIDQDFGWIDRTWLWPAFDTTPQRALDIHLYLGCYPTPPIYHWLQSVGTGTAPDTAQSLQGFGSSPIFHEFDRELQTFQGKIFVSEIGCGALTNLDRTAAGFAGFENCLDARQAIDLRDGLHQGFKQRGLAKVFGSVEQLYAEAQAMHGRGLARQLEAVLTNPRISGFMVTQLNDLTWELEAGLLDVWRNPKSAYQAVKRLNQPHCLIASPQALTVNPGDSVNIEVWLLNQAPLAGSEQLEVAIQNNTGALTTYQLMQPVFSTGLHQLKPFIITTSEGCGSYRILFRLMRGQSVLAETAEIIHCLPPVHWDDLEAKVAFWGSTPPLLHSEALRGHFAHPASSEAAGQAIVVSAPSEVSVVDWRVILQAAEGGANVIIGALNPPDQLACQTLVNAGLPIELHMGYGSWMGCHHWLPESRLTNHLPKSKGLTEEYFADLLPRYVLAELGGSVLAGSIRCSTNRDFPKTIGFRSDIEQVSFGKGRLILCQYRLFEQAYAHPLASQMAYNLLRLATQV